MKIKEGFVLREVMGQSVAVPVGENSKQFHGMIKLNATGAEIWKDLEKGLTKEQIAQRIADEYESIELEEALLKVEQFLKKLEDAGITE
ncbi:MAG: PqqD family protein [Agathobacter sp.]|nr:PqqD family protein [Agathobacter sp.]